MNSFDQSLFNALYGLAHQNSFFDGLIVFLAGYLQYFLIILAIILLFVKQKDWRRQLHIVSVFLLSAILSRGLITEIIRFLYNRSRPFLAFELTPLINHDLTNSFPSGHMTFYFVLALSIFLLSKKWGWFFVVSVILMGLARIIAGVHWPTDIIGGILIAAACYFLVKKLLPFKNKTAE
jgi:undecaprenyl-diphosphatase